MESKLAVYAGSFDPLTLGHMWMIERGAEQFDRLIVAIGANPNKQCLFTMEERLDMLRESVRHLSNVKAAIFPYELLVIYAKSVGAKFILRGIRSIADYAYERDMRDINSDQAPDITTAFLMPPQELAKISSSAVKGLFGPIGGEEAAQKYVSPLVFAKLKEKLHAGYK